MGGGCNKSRSKFFSVVVVAGSPFVWCYPGDGLLLCFLLFIWT